VGQDTLIIKFTQTRPEPLNEVTTTMSAE